MRPLLRPMNYAKAVQSRWDARYKELGMGDAGDVPMNSQYMDYAEHERTYRAFLWAAKWGTVAVSVIVILMAIFLV